jgi:Protein of unknown function (DUF3618)
MPPVGSGGAAGCHRDDRRTSGGRRAGAAGVHPAIGERATSVPQDPTVIQRQIEDTRAELAETLDAIAEIVSPKRVAERANEQIRVKVAELRRRVLPSGEGTGRRAIEAGPGDVRHAEVDVPAGELELRRTVRWGRVAVASGSLLLLVVGVGRRRRRRRAARSARRG